MNIRLFFIFLAVIGIVMARIWYVRSPTMNRDLSTNIQISNNDGGLINEPNPLSIEYMRTQEYPGSEITIEQTLPDGSNYSRAIVSYKSDGLKIYALLTVPMGEKPKTGWPVIIFNHGYIPPEQYRTTEKYLTYTDAFSRNGYIVFKSDYRGHGSSEGKPEGAYYSPTYTIDVLNAISSIKKYKDPSTSRLLADPQRVGMWGHSMGGTITLRSMVVTKDIKVGVVWAGVVASYKDLTNNWHHPDLNRPRFTPSPREQTAGRPGRQSFIEKYGSFDANPTFWQSISPIYFVDDISGPIQLHHGSTDTEVPILFSNKLNNALKKSGKTVEMFTYEGDDHNLSNNLNIALQRSVDFFDKYLKNRK